MTRSKPRSGNRLRRILKTVDVTVFSIAMSVVAVFVLFGVLFQSAAQGTFGAMHAFVTEYFGWYYMLAVTVFLVFAVWLMFSRYGRIRLGPATDKPEFGFIAWFSMLFSAGMGIGLIFWSIAEPITHFQNPPSDVGSRAEAAGQAMMFTFLHWGLHAWAIYTIVALTLAYFSYRFRMPFTIRSIFYPMLGDRIYGPIGHTIDILAVFATLFGLATSLGLGVLQLNTGLNILAGIEVSVTTQVVLIGLITMVAVASVVSGLHRGLKWISIFNLVLITSLMAFIFTVGPTLFNLRFLIDTTGEYLQNIVRLSLWNDAAGGSEFQKEWTVFYWAWWIAWSPFVGIFIARVSRGRTIRQFVAGTLLLPTLFVFAWLIIFGGTALNLELAAGDAGAGIAAAVSDDVTQALYVTLAQLPWAGITSLVASVLIATYFITSSDSATYVVDALITRGSKRSPARQRVIWGVTEGAIAAVLLVAGGEAALQALQTASLVTGLPFSLILLLVCWNLYRVLRREFDVAGMSAGAR
jgi:choline/glycine/proline betaine transport protein